MWSVKKVAVIGFILCRLGNLIFSVRSGLVRGGKSPSPTKWTGTSFLPLPVSPGLAEADLTDGFLMLEFIINFFFHRVADAKRKLDPRNFPPRCI